MDAFNLVAGIISILAAVFAVYVYADAKRKEAVETQKAREYQHRLADLVSMANAVAQQGSLIATMADRDEVTKKELKHLAISQLQTVQSMQRSLVRTNAVEERWRFGVPATYVSLESAGKGEQPGAAPDHG